jgi:hypothetical protein
MCLYKYLLWIRQLVITLLAFIRISNADFLVDIVASPVRHTKFCHSNKNISVAKRVDLDQVRLSRVRVAKRRDRAWRARIGGRDRRHGSLAKFRIRFIIFGGKLY